MNNASQETTNTETKQLEITDENISLADYTRLRSGEKVEVEVEKSAPEAKASSKTADESDTSKLEAKEDDSDEESDADGTDEASELEKPKKKSGTQRRIEKLVKQRSEVERERDLLREQLAKYQTPPEEKKPVVNLEGKPKSDDYESYDDYVEALADWKTDQKQKARDEVAKKEAAKNQITERVKTHNERVDAYRKDHAEFDEHLTAFFEDQGTSFNVSPALQDELTNSEHSAEILHALVKSPEEFLRLNSLDEKSVARAIGRIEASLQKPSESKNVETKKLTKAPAPVAPVSAKSSSVKKSVYDESTSFTEYEKLRREQMRKKR